MPGHILSGYRTPNWAISHINNLHFHLQYFPTKGHYFYLSIHQKFERDYSRSETQGMALVMSYCIIAVKENFRIKSVFCRYEDNLEALLNESYDGFESAKHLVDHGDISSLVKGEVRYYFRDWGFDWKYSRPVEFYNRQVLREYAQGAMIDMIYVFEDGRWKKECLNERSQPVSFSHVA